MRDRAGLGLATCLYDNHLDVGLGLGIAVVVVVAAVVGILVSVAVEIACGLDLLEVSGIDSLGKGVACSKESDATVSEDLRFKIAG